MSEVVEVTSEGLSDLSRALTKKRLDYVKVTNTLSEAPRGVADLVSQSRNFVDKLTHFLEDGSELSDQVRRELIDEKGFPGQVYKLPLDNLYNDINHVKEELRIADGYQPYLVAPEAGLRRLFQRSIERLVDPVRDLVEAVYELVATAVDRALKESCQVPALERGPPIVRFPHFIESVLPVALSGLEDLKDETSKMATKIVEMEGSFVTCSFFRYLTFKRIKDQDEARKLRDSEAIASNGGRLGRSRTQESDDEGEDDDDDQNSIAETEVSTPPVIPGDYVPNVYQSADAVFGMSGYLQKSSSHSRNKMTRTEMSLWQRRFFGVRDSTKTLEYYTNEDSFLKGAQPGAIIQLTDCTVNDTDGQGVLPDSTLSRSKEHLDAETQVSLLILLRTKDPKRNIYKNSKDLILRAEHAAEKYQWLSYLRTSCNDTRSGARVATWTTKALVRPSSDTSVASVQARDFHPDEDYGELIGEGIGLGSAVFWSELCRDKNNLLYPSPGLYYEGDQEHSMERAIMQHSADMKAYTKLACETLVMTIPKVIVHGLVDKSIDKLGPKIEEHILQLNSEERDQLLAENESITGHRQQISDTIKRIGEAEDKIKDAGMNMGEDTNVKIPVAIIELAGLSARLKTQEDGTYVFKNKPPPNPNRNTTPERPTTGQQPQPVAGSNQPRPQIRTQPQPPPQRPTVNAQPAIRSGGSQNMTGGSAGGQRPRRQAPVAPAAAANVQRQFTSTGQPTGQPNPGTNTAQPNVTRNSQAKTQQTSGWGLFRQPGK